MKECYVIYARHHNKKTEAFEGVCIIFCVDTEEKVRKFFELIINKYNAKYINEDVVLIDDERYPFLEFVTYDKAEYIFDEPKNQELKWDDSRYKHLMG